MNPRKKIALQADLLCVPRVANAVTKNTLRIRAPESETPLVIVDDSGLLENCDAFNANQLTNTLPAQPPGFIQIRAGRWTDPQARTNKRIGTGLTRNGGWDAEVRGSKQLPVFDSCL
jgi:hypothetical protein